MRLTEVKQSLKKNGQLDDRELISYATLAGTIHGNSFQNVVAVVFQENTLTLYRAEIDGRLDDVLDSVPYCDMERFQLRHRFLYSFTEFDAPAGHFRFYSYDKKVFLQGFRDAGLAEDKA